MTTLSANFGKSECPTTDVPLVVEYSGLVQGLFVQLGCAALACATCGCSSDESSGTPDSGGPGDETCMLVVELEGALDQDLTWDLSEGCGGGADTAARTVSLGWGGITMLQRRGRRG